jgi:hypothetical protein
MLAATAKLFEDLGSPNIEKRVAAIAGLRENPTDSRTGLAALVVDPAASEIARVWAAIAIAQIGDDVDRCTSAALIGALASSAPAVRWSSLHALGQLHAEHAVPAIANCLHDDSEVVGAWFDDDCRVSQAAQAALREIGTSEALHALDKASAG